MFHRSETTSPHVFFNLFCTLDAHLSVELIRAYASALPTVDAHAVVVDAEIFSEVVDLLSRQIYAIGCVLLRSKHQQIVLAKDDEWAMQAEISEQLSMMELSSNLRNVSALADRAKALVELLSGVLRFCTLVDEEVLSNVSRVAAVVDALGEDFSAIGRKFRTGSPPLASTSFETTPMAEPNDIYVFNYGLSGWKEACLRLIDQVSSAKQDLRVFNVLVENISVISDIECVRHLLAQFSTVVEMKDLRVREAYFKIVKGAFKNLSICERAEVVVYFAGLHGCAKMSDKVLVLELPQTSARNPNKFEDLRNACFSSLLASTSSDALACELAWLCLFEPKMTLWQCFGQATAPSAEITRVVADALGRLGALLRYRNGEASLAIGGIRKKFEELWAHGRQGKTDAFVDFTMMLIENGALDATEVLGLCVLENVKKAVDEIDAVEGPSQKVVQLVNGALSLGVRTLHEAFVKIRFLRDEDYGIVGTGNNAGSPVDRAALFALLATAFRTSVDSKRFSRVFPLPNALLDFVDELIAQMEANNTKIGEREWAKLSKDLGENWSDKWGVERAFRELVGTVLASSVEISDEQQPETLVEQVCTRTEIIVRLRKQLELEQSATVVEMDEKN